MQLGVAARSCLHEERKIVRKRQTSRDKELNRRELKHKRCVFMVAITRIFACTMRRQLLDVKADVKAGVKARELQDRP